MIPDEKLQLCYVEGNKAYFTSKALSEQWGDDWNDAPYEHNAERPYTPYSKGDFNEDGTPKWVIREFVFYGPFMQPSDGYSSSPYSVESINKGAVPWLVSNEYAKSEVYIAAGTTLPDFVAAVEAAGGVAWEAEEVKE